MQSNREKGGWWKPGRRGDGGARRSRGQEVRCTRRAAASGTRIPAHPPIVLGEALEEFPPRLFNGTFFYECWEVERRVGMRVAANCTRAPADPPIF